MIAKILIILIVGWLFLELIEHVLFPLVWSFISRKRRSLCGNEGMLSKVVEVRSWKNGKGCVFVDGELWNAESDDPLQPGSKAVVQEIDGLVLRIVESTSEGKGSKTA